MPKRSSSEVELDIDVRDIAEARVPSRQLLASGARRASAKAKAGGFAERTLQRRLHDFTYLQAREDTPYGPMIKHFEVINKGRTFCLEYICPYALLFSACRQSALFASFLSGCLAGATASLIFYIDSVTPGNPMRFDSGRSYQALYWTVKEYPGWFRKRNDGSGWHTVTGSAIPSFLQCQFLKVLIFCRFGCVGNGLEMECFQFRNLGARPPR